MKEYSIKFTDVQLQDLINVICSAPVPRNVTDPMMDHLQKAVVAQDAVSDNGVPKGPPNRVIKEGEAPPKPGEPR